MKTHNSIVSARSVTDTFQCSQGSLSFKAHRAGIDTVAFTPNGYRLAGVSRIGTEKIFHATPLPEKP